jgi:chromosome segregation ATPase
LSSSNETFRRSRVYSYLAGALTVLGLGGIGVLLFQVSELSERYGQIERDIAHYSGQRDQLLTAREGLSAEISTLDTRLQGVRDDLRRAEQSRNEAIAAEKAALDARDVAQATLESLLERETAAKGVIAAAERERDRLQSLTAQNGDLQRSVADLDGKKGSLETAVSDLRAKEGKLQDAIRLLRDQRDAASVAVEQLKLETQVLERLKDRVDALTSEEADIGNQLLEAQTALSKIEGERKTAEDRLSGLKAQVDQEAIKLEEARRDRGTAEGQLASLQVQVDSLVRQKADQIRDADEAQARLDQAQLDLQTALSARQQAETTLASSSQTIKQVEAELATILADRDNAADELAEIKRDIERDRAILAQIKAARSEIETLRGQREALDKEVQDRQKDLGELGVKLTIATDALRKAEESLPSILSRRAAAESAEAAAIDRKTTLDAEIQRNNARETALKDALTAARAALGKAEADRDEALRAQTSAEEDLERLKQMIGGRQAVLAAVIAAETRSKDLLALIDDLERTRNDRLDEVSKAGAALQAALLELQDVRDHVATLRSQQDALSRVLDSSGTPEAPSVQDRSQPAD